MPKRWEDGKEIRLARAIWALRTGLERGLLCLCRVRKPLQFQHRTVFRNTYLTREPQRLSGLAPGMFLPRSAKFTILSTAAIFQIGGDAPGCIDSPHSIRLSRPRGQFREAKSASSTTNTPAASSPSDPRYFSCISTRRIALKHPPSPSPELRTRLADRLILFTLRPQFASGGEPLAGFQSLEHRTQLHKMNSIEMPITLFPLVSYPSFPWTWSRWQSTCQGGRIAISLFVGDFGWPDREETLSVSSGRSSPLKSWLLAWLLGNHRFIEDGGALQRRLAGTDHK